MVMNSREKATHRRCIFSHQQGDGSDKDTFTTTVVDANGNPVGNYNGTIEVNSTYGQLQDTSGNALAQDPVTGDYEVNIQNGVGKFQLTTSSTAHAGDQTTITPSDLANAPSGVNIGYGATTVNLTAATSTNLGLGIESGYAPSISVNQAPNAGQLPSTELHLALNDASGVPVSGSYATVTLTLSGPGSFSETSSLKTEVVGVNETGNVPVYGEVGQAGTISVTATATGFSPATLNIPAVINTATSGLKVLTKNTTDSAGNPVTIYTVELVDTNGNVVSTNSTDTISVSPTNLSTTGGTLSYYPVQSNGTVTAGTGSGTAPSLTLENGVAQFAVETVTEGSGAVDFNRKRQALHTFRIPFQASIMPLKSL